MCGLVALVGSHALLEISLRHMRDQLVHRGPDDAGIWLHNYSHRQVGMAFRRLSIQDLSSHGHQPMPGADGQVMLVFNGEIYNFVELRSELSRLGHGFAGGSDSEVLLAAYLQWGKDCISKLNGQFAFCIWDERQGRMLVARDRFGEKPLYFARLQSGGLAFASEMKALLAHPEVSDVPNWEQIRQFSDGAADYGGSGTTFQHIERFLAAHVMEVSLDGQVLSYERYWTPQTQSVQRQARLSDLVEEFRQRLQASVTMRMRADVTLGACLSGGLDSSALVALMVGAHDVAPLSATVSARFPSDPTIDEGAYIDQVLNFHGVRGVSADISPAELQREFESLHWHHETPLLSASAYLEWCVHAKARRSGLTVMIDGQGADELLGGYQHYFPVRQNDWFNTGQWGALVWNTWLHQGRLWLEARKYAHAERRFNPKGALPMRHYLSIAARNVPRKLHGQPLLEQPIELDKPGVPSSANGGFFRQFLADGFLYTSMPMQLVVSDRNAMAFGVEARFPFLDYGLVDWCLTLPENFNIRHGWQKWGLRKAVEGLLPKAVQWRRDKVGFRPPQDEWLRRQLKDWAYDLLTTGPVTDLPNYDRGWIDVVWAKHQQGEELSWPLWRWISTSQWLRMHAAGAWRPKQVLSA
jgi:asparagine synthase (glutamine-hydrolysing)